MNFIYEVLDDGIQMILLCNIGLRSQNIDDDICFATLNHDPPPSCHLLLTHAWSAREYIGERNSVTLGDTCAYDKPEMRIKISNGEHYIHR